MDLAMSTLARIHLIAANEALMRDDTTAAFSQMNLAYLHDRNEGHGYHE
jgi:hypothetical protein